MGYELIAVLLRPEFVVRDNQRENFSSSAGIRTRLLRRAKTPLSTMYKSWISNKLVFFSILMKIVQESALILKNVKIIQMPRWKCITLSVHACTPSESRVRKVGEY